MIFGVWVGEGKGKKEGGRREGAGVLDKHEGCWMMFERGEKVM